MCIGEIYFILENNFIIQFVLIRWSISYILANNNIAAGRWFFPGIPVSSANKTDHHDITEMLSKVG
jgi:hypothetical protein